MKLLITGKNSYIGNAVNNWLKLKVPNLIVHQISFRNLELKNFSFKDYDSILHVAGIAHISSNKNLISQYFKINRDLAIEVAIKAKSEGIKQFIFISTMAIYGDDRNIGDFKPVDIDKPSPTSAYSQSKLDADLTIQNLQDENFKVSILRIPMVYGKTAKGNFLKLINISKKFPIFPKIKNIRSVLHINNLSELIRLIILNKINGVFYPQDQKYFNTTDFISSYRTGIGKITLFIPFFSFLLCSVGFFFKSVNKIYGNKFYECKYSQINNINYQLFSISDVINELKDI